MDFLFNFNKKRNFGGAFLFCVVYLILLLLLLMGSGYLIGLGKTVEEAQKQAMMAGRVIGIAFPILLALLIVRAKGLFKNAVAIVGMVLTLLVTLFVSPMFGLLPAAFLTTRAPNKKRK